MLKCKLAVCYIQSAHERKTTLSRCFSESSDGIETCYHPISADKGSGAAGAELPNISGVCSIQVPPQFNYQKNVQVEDKGLYLVHHTHTFLDRVKGAVVIVFIVFSSAF